MQYLFRIDVKITKYKKLFFKNSRHSHECKKIRRYINCFLVGKRVTA